MRSTPRSRRWRGARPAVVATAVTLVAAACGAGTARDDVLTVYSGRGEDLVGPIVADFEEQTGVDVEVRYGETSELADQLVEEGAATSADVFWAQDAGDLAAVAEQGLLAVLPDDLLDRVDEATRSAAGEWMGVTGRVRALVYSTERVSEAALPASVLDLTDERWEGRVGWAPGNGSFQSFVTAMRVDLGEDTTRDWLEAMLANGVVDFPNNTSQVEAVGRGEIDVGLVNHYYLLRFTNDDPGFPAANHFPPGDVGSLLNVTGVGRLAGSGDTDLAEQFIGYLLTEEVQAYFAGFPGEAEYPLVAGVEAADGLPPLAALDPPDVDLSDLSDVEGTRELLREVGALG